MHATTPLKALSKSLHYLLVFLSDNIVTVASFVILGLSTLVAHKSVEQLRFWGVPSAYVERMELLHAFIWLMCALAIAWLCTVGTIRFCRKVSRG
jgi:hypothetical protein